MVIFFLPGPPSLNVSLLRKKRRKKGEGNKPNLNHRKGSKVKFHFLSFFFFFDSRSEILKRGAKKNYVE